MEKVKKPRKKKIVSELDQSIEMFLKKNRVFSKTEKEPNENINEFEYIVDLIDNLDNDESINYVIIQLGIIEDTNERFLYTDDCHVIIVFNTDLYYKLQEHNYSNIEQLNILFFDKQNGLKNKKEKIKI